MTINIMNQYIDITKKLIHDYLKLVLGNKFSFKYYEKFTEEYINIRYYNFYESDINNSMRRKILEHLRDMQDDLCMNDIENRIIIQDSYTFFHYVLYFDNVIRFRDIQNVVKRIARERIKTLEKEDENFEKELLDIINKYDAEKQELLKKFETEDFKIKITNYPEKLNVYRVKIKHNIEFPIIFSEYAINKAFNMGITNEDKLFVEYYLIVIQVLQDILKANFEKKYIVQFADTLLEKSKKLKGLLNIINNDVVQDKICMKIKYEQFMGKKDKVFDLIQEGYRFAIVIDKTFKASVKNIEELKAFKYVILDQQLGTYDQIMEYEKSLKNVIKI